MVDPTIICVTGMHRCGTSLVARVLNLLGVGLGPEEHLMGPRESNPKGHWENQPTVDLNDEILAFLGGSWDEPPALDPCWHRSPGIVNLRQKAEAILQADFAGVDLWAWKDPRSSVTLPFWQDMLPPLKYVICLRNPLDAASSLLQRNHFSIEKSGRLWLTYIASAIKNTSGQPRLFVFYEDLLNDWRAQVARIVTFINRPGSTPDAAAMASIAEFVDQELGHYRTPLVPSLAEIGIPFAAQALYLALRVTVSVLKSQDSARAIGDHEISAAIDVFSQMCLEADARLVAVKDEAAELTRTVKLQEQKLQTLVAELAGAKDKAGALMEQLAQVTRTVDLQKQELQALAADLAGRLNEKDQALASLSSSLGSLTQQLSEREKQVAGMEQSVSWRWTRPLRQVKGWIRSLVSRR